MNTLPDGIKPLSPFTGNYRDTPNDELGTQEQRGIIFSLTDYLQLVEETTRVIRHGKRGYLSQQTPPILERLNISQQQWLQQTTEFERIYNKQFRQQHTKLKETNTS